MKKEKLLKFLTAICASPLVRGLLKSLPLGNLIYEIGRTVKFSNDSNNAGQTPPHSVVSMCVQALVLGYIIYAFATHQVTVDQVLKYFVSSDAQPDPLVIQDSVLVK